MREATQEEKQKMAMVEKAILDGQIYATVTNVSRSGMSRRIAFYMVKDGQMERVTSIIGWMSERIPLGARNQGKRWVDDSGGRVLVPRGGTGI